MTTEEKLEITLKALKKIVCMEEGEYETEVECAHPTMESCGTCLEMKDIAREALHNCSEEHK